MTVAELLEKPESWTQNVAARNANGKEVDYLSQDACCWCLAGALTRVYQTCKSWGVARNKLMAACDAKGIDTHWITWQDAPERTHAEVLALVKEAGI